MPESRAPYVVTGIPGFGWLSSFPDFSSSPAATVREALLAFAGDAGKAQLDAWRDSIPPLQQEVREVLRRERFSRSYTALLEYELPYELRRPDVIFLAGKGLFVLELKGKSRADRADIDQASAYGRDLRAYHRECHDRPVHPALVLTRARGRIGFDAGVHIVGIDAVDDLVNELDEPHEPPAITPDAFLEADSYCPAPTLIEAAREIARRYELRWVARAQPSTRPAIEAITEIIHDAARRKERRLVLLTGAPGSGKTLVGIKIAHERFLDDLAVARSDGRRRPAAVFLSGNGPLVQVLQYQLRDVEGRGRTFVRPVKDYVSWYTLKHPEAIPPEHVLIYDEAQRAWDAEQVATKHSLGGPAKSEPEHFIEFAERIPDWCVVIGLIGQGQEIHVGEEAGIAQWRQAIEGSPDATSWRVFVSERVLPEFGSLPRTHFDDRLHLDGALRFHFAGSVESLAAGVVRGDPASQLAPLASALEREGFHLRITRDLEAARQYLRDRYVDDPDARFGLMASARDKELWRFGVANQLSPTRFPYGAWYVEGDGDYLGRSCRALRDCVTEFGAQGLELDATLLAWGTDFIRDGGRWTNRYAKRYLNLRRVKDPFQLRMNAYRVLLTRGRDGTVVFVPPIPLMDATFEYLRDSGFRRLDESSMHT
jgi:hypothetical protein